MWWCCGKIGKEAPGCKHGKHVSKEDEDDQENMALQMYGDNSNVKNLKCPVFIYDHIDL